MDIKDGRKVALNKRWCYLLLVLVIVLPVVVGVAVWYFTKSACDGGTKDAGNSSKLPVSGDNDLKSSTTQTTTEVDEKDEPWKTLRLPSHIIPIHYSITLYPDFYGTNGWFYGNETVELKVTSATNVILIHANFLNITRTSLRYASGKDITISKAFWYEENQFWVIETEYEIWPSILFLDLEFDGSLTRAILGFYKSSYVNSITNEER